MKSYLCLVTILFHLSIVGQSLTIRKAKEAVEISNRLYNENKFEEALMIVTPIREQLLAKENLNDLNNFLIYYNLYNIELKIHWLGKSNTKISSFAKLENLKIKDNLFSEHLKWFYYNTSIKSILYKTLKENKIASNLLETADKRLDSLQKILKEEHFTYLDNKEDLIKYIKLNRYTMSVSNANLNGMTPSFNKDSVARAFKYFDENFSVRIFQSKEIDRGGLGYDFTNYKEWSGYEGIMGNVAFIDNEIDRISKIIENGFYNMAIKKSKELLEQINQKDYTTDNNQRFLTIKESIYLNMHIAYKKLEQFDQAYHYLNEAKSKYEKAINKKGTKRFKYEVLFEDFYFNKGEYGKAIDYAQIQLNFGSYYQDKTGSISLYHRLLGDFENAINYQKEYNNWLRIELNKYGRKPTVVNDVFLANLYLENEQYELAKSLLDSIFIKVSQKKNNSLNTEKDDLAKELFNKTMDFYNPLSGNLEHLYLDKSAFVNALLGNEKKADELMERHLKSYTSYLFEYLLVPADNEKSRNLTKGYQNSNIFYYVQQRSSNSGQVVAQAYDIALLSKQLLLNTSKTINKTLEESPNSLMREYNSRLKRIKKSLKNITINQKDSLMDYARYYEKEIIDTWGEAILKELNKSVISWQDIQTKLKPGEAAIEFINFQPYSFSASDKISVGNKQEKKLYGAFLLKKESKTPIFIDLFKEKDLLELIKLAKKGTDSDKDKISKLYNLYGDELYKLIWQPLNNELKNIHKVYYSPSGILNNIAFTALRKNVNLPTVGEKFNLIQLLSTKSILENTVANNFSRALLLGDIAYNKKSSIENSVLQKSNVRSSIFKELPGTRLEIIELENLLNNNQIIYSKYLREEATEENFYKALNEESVNIIHIATHAFYLPPLNLEKNRISQFLGWSLFKKSNDPMNRSGLALSGANEFWVNGDDININEKDGILTANEISNLELHQVKLAVLSACETALGDVYNNEGIFGLQRGLKIAGIQNLLVSLWKVDDKATKEFMTEFYTNLIQRKLELQDAFDSTQKSFKLIYPDPYYWAAFILIQ